MKISISGEELLSIWTNENIKQEEKYIINIDQENSKLTLSSSGEVVLEENIPNELYETIDQHIMDIVLS